VAPIGKSFPTISKHVFKDKSPNPTQYVAAAKSIFQSPFFDALAKYCEQVDGAEHFICRVLGVTMADAKALSAELRK
jgi:hypothetical protein